MQFGAIGPTCAKRASSEEVIRGHQRSSEVIRGHQRTHLCKESVIVLVHRLADGLSIERYDGVHNRVEVGGLEVRVA